MALSALIAQSECGLPSEVESLNFSRRRPFLFRANKIQVLSPSLTYRTPGAAELRIQKMEVLRPSDDEDEDDYSYEERRGRRGGKKKSSKKKKKKARDESSDEEEEEDDEEEEEEEDDEEEEDEEEEEEEEEERTPKKKVCNTSSSTFGPQIGDIITCNVCVVCHMVCT